MKTTTPILSELQSKTLGDTSRTYIDGKDLNYNGNNISEEGSSFVLDGTDAIKNKVLFWLSSAEGDYVREPDKGGVLWRLIGNSLIDSNVSQIQKDIVTYFNASFQGELNLIKVNITRDLENRKWQIQLFVQDPIRREIFNTSVEVSV